MKKQYENLELNVFLIKEDVITTSVAQFEKGGTWNPDWDEE